MIFAKKNIIPIVIIFILGFGIGVWWGWWRSNRISYKAAESIISDNNSFVGEYKVVRVIDGDTIEIEGGERVRYIGMDAPERYNAEKPVCYADEAAAKNKELVEGKTVRLERDISDKDKYGRLLRYVYLGDDFINLELVKLGFAKAANFPPDEKYRADFSTAETSAKNSRLGLWSACQ